LCVPSALANVTVSPGEIFSSLGVNFLSEAVIVGA
jgi:hypothetical protein